MIGYQDSTGQPIHIGDRVRWRGQEYTITGFHPGAGTNGTAAIDFDREPHLDEVPDEISVDLIRNQQP